MILNIKGKAISSAHYDSKQGKLPQLVINTTDRYARWVYTESGVSYIRYTYKYKSYVELIAEDERDIEVLSRIRYENLCKDQLIVAFIPLDLLI